MAKKLVMILGVVFILVGLLGFVMDPILGIFQVDLVHNLVHLASGVLAVIFAGKAAPGYAMAKLIIKLINGVVYALVAVFGLVLPGEKVLGLIEANLADDILHVVLAAVFLYAGFGLKGDMTVKKDMGMGENKDMM